MTFTSETALHKAVIKRLREHYRGDAIKVHGGGHRGGRSGEPDVLGCVSGRMVQVECKQPGNTPTVLQLARLRAWQRAGALSGWVTSLEELDELMTHLGQYDWANPAL